MHRTLIQAATEYHPMSEDGPRPNNPLSPYYPSEIPSLRGNGRRWVAILLVIVLLGGSLLGTIAIVL